MQRHAKPMVWIVAALAGFPGSVGAFCRQPEEVPAVEKAPGDLATVTEAEMGPQELPGREKGERERTAEAPAVPPAPAPATERSFWEWDRLSGDWCGRREKLESSGITFNASFTYHVSSVVDGGQHERAGSRTLWDVNAALDFDKLMGWSGGSFFVDFQSSDDRGRLADAGAFQLPGNIEYGRNIDEVGEAWYQQKLFGDVLRLKLGKIDANSEFGFVNAAGDLLNGSASFSPTVLAMPTVPAQATGIVAFVYPWDKVYVGGGFFDGATQDGIRTGGRGPADFFSDSRSDSWYWMGEAGCGWDWKGLGDGRVAVGGWHETGDVARWDGGVENGSSGGYALVEQQVWRAGEGDEEKCRGLFVFGQYGWADKDVAAVGQHFAAGVTLRGVCKSRCSDGMGFYWSMADASKDVLTGADRDEHAFEVYYKAQITPWVYVQPDVQFFINPSGRSGIEDSTVLGVQVGVTF